MDFSGIFDLWIKLVTAGTAAACLIALVVTGFELWRMPEKTSPGRRRILRRYMALSLVMAVLCTLSAWLVTRWNEQRDDDLKKDRQDLQQLVDITKEKNRRIFERMDAFAEKMEERDARVKALGDDLIVLAKAGKLDGQDYSSVAQKLTLLARDSDAMKRIIEDLKRFKLEAENKDHPGVAPQSAEPAPAPASGEAAVKSASPAPPRAPAPAEARADAPAPTEEPKDQPGDTAR